MSFGRTIWVITRRLVMLVTFVVAFIVSAATAYYFSRGSEVSIPNLVGKTEIEAKQSATNLGIKIEVIDIFDSKESPGRIIRQFPKAGAIIRKSGSTVLRVNVSRTK